MTADYAAARQTRGHRERSTAVLSVEGPDRSAFLQGQLTQDVKTLSAGETRPAAGLNAKGKLIYFGRVHAQIERILLLVESTSRDAVLAHLRKYAVFQKVTVNDASDSLIEIGLYGPGASAIEAAAGDAKLPADGEFSAALLAPASARDALLLRLDEAGSVAVSDDTAEILRVEAGRPRMGQDADQTNLPDEVGLQAAIATNKGCYVGQEIVARLRTYGRANRRLVGLRFPAGPVSRDTVFPDPGKPDLELLRVSSSVVSPRLGAIGLGLAFREVPDGGSLGFSGESGPVAVVIALPFA